MRALTRQIGEPMPFTEGSAEQFFENLKTDTLMALKFALVLNIKTMRIEKYLNTAKFLAYEGAFDLNKFFYCLHPDFILDFLKWGQAIYRYTLTKQQDVKPLQQVVRMTIPLKLTDGGYYWVLQEAIPLELDAENRLVSHLNIYTVIRPMEKNEKVQIAGRIYNNGFEMKEWTQLIWKDYFTHRPFTPSREERRTLDLLNKNGQLTNAEIAQQLGKQRNTIEVQNKKILERAREAFDNQSFTTIKDVVQFLKDIHYFEEQDHSDTP